MNCPSRRLPYPIYRGATVREHSGSPCPFCANRTVLPGSNDLAMLSPGLAAQWDASPGANRRSPWEVTIGSTYRAQWRCRFDHTWRATVTSRSKGHGCPFCSGRIAIPGETDLATLRPDLAAEWDSSNSLSPNQVTCASGLKAMWRCSRGHTWRTAIATRSKGHGCPHCGRLRATRYLLHTQFGE
ncbi:zinc-ribbon domain-containing protein [Pseudoclavibacter helvolus]|uniref:zinc-ribbon domain-containing protein n=1 Tax=Pseudoclavibacter helvolus TaxID=255205 RepID=UPI003D15A990